MAMAEGVEVTDTMATTIQCMARGTQIDIIRMVVRPMEVIWTLALGVCMAGRIRICSPLMETLMEILMETLTEILMGEAMICPMTPTEILMAIIRGATDDLSTRILMDNLRAQVKDERNQIFRRGKREKVR